MWNAGGVDGLLQVHAVQRRGSGRTPATTGPAGRRPACRTPGTALAVSQCEARRQRGPRPATGASVLARPGVRVNICALVPRQKPRPGMTGELCSQPPLGVAETMLPNRSATSRWQVSPGPSSAPAAVGRRLPAAPGWPARRVRGRSSPARSRQPRRHAVRRTRPQLADAVRADERAPRTPRTPPTAARRAGPSTAAGRRTRPPGRRTPAWRPRSRCGCSAALPGSAAQCRGRPAGASCWRKTGPCPHGPVLQTVRPRNSAVTGASRASPPAGQVAPVSRPRWRRPVMSMTSALAR